MLGRSLWQRPYHVEHTSSRPITEVKQRWAGLVLGWETAWEFPVLLAFFQSKHIIGADAVTNILPIVFGNGHTTLNIPVLVRSLKSSNVGLG